MAAYSRSTARLFLGLFLVLGLLACSFPYMLMAALREPTATPTITDTPTITATFSPTVTSSATPVTPTETGLPLPTFGAATTTNTPTASVPAPILTVYTPIAVLGAPNMLNPLTVSDKMRPNYQWSPVANASTYTIWVWILSRDGEKKDLIINEQHLASHICNSTLCTIRPEAQLTDGRKYTWVVQAYGLPGYGPFSQQITFTANKLTPMPEAGTPMCPLSVAGKFGGGLVKAVAYDTANSITFISEGAVISAFKGDYLKPKASITMPAEVVNLAVRGNYLYVADGNKGLRIINFSTDGSSLAEVGYDSANSTAANDVKIYKTYALVADGTNGFKAFDIQDPQAPKYLRSSVISGGTANGLAVNGDIAYVAFGSKGVYKYNIASLPSGLQVDSYNNFDVVSANAVVGLSDAVWIADGANGVKWLPTADNRFIATSAPTPTMDSTGNKKYVISSNIAPTAIANDASHVFAIGGQIIQKFSIESTPAVGAAEALLSEGYKIYIPTVVALASPQMYIADGSSGLKYSINQAMPPVSAYDSSMNVYDVTVKTGTDGLPYAYLADYNGRVVKLNLSTPNAPSMINSINTSSGNPYAIEVDDSSHYAYVAANDGGLQKIDLIGSDPVSPCNTSGFAKAVALYPGYEFVAVNDKGLDVCSTSMGVPQNQPLSSGLANGVTISGNRAYVAAYQGGLAAFDITNPTLPSALWTYNPTTGTYSRGVAASGSYAYLALDTNGLQVVDVAQATPVYKGALDTPGNAYDVQLFSYNNSLYAALADYGAGVNIVDVHDPTKPLSACTLDTAGNARAVYVSGRYIYVADESNGLLILSMP